MKEKIKPTVAELEILQILWKFNAETVRFVHEKLDKKKDTGYTTTLKIMQNMTAKGLLKRKLSGRSHIYSPAFSQHETRELLLNKFLESAFGGSASQLVMQLMGSNKTSSEELNQIRELIANYENRKP